MYAGTYAAAPTHNQAVCLFIASQHTLDQLSTLLLKYVWVEVAGWSGVVGRRAMSVLVRREVEDFRHQHIGSVR